MNPNPFAALAHSRKFWLLILNVFVSLVLYFVGKYAAPGIFDDVKVVIGLIQPVFVAIIIAIAVEDAANMRASADASWWDDDDDTEAEK